jgi:hypothetical protein
MVALAFLSHLPCWQAYSEGTLIAYNQREVSKFWRSGLQHKLPLISFGNFVQVNCNVHSI